MAPRFQSFSFLHFCSLVHRILLIAAFCAFTQIPVSAKDVPLTAIELFDGPAGAAYAQITEVLINGKSEVRACGSVEKIDKSAYGKLPKVSLAGATSLERNSKGVLMLSRNSETVCVVPANLKFEKGWGDSASDLADHAVLQAKVLSSSPAGQNAVPELKAGVRIVFVPQPDTELAEYLRADRTHAIAGWQDFLARYPKSAHSATARQSLAALLENEGEGGLASYRKSVSTAAVAYPDLQKAWLRDQQALDLVRTDSAASKLRDDIRTELRALTDKSRAEFQAYQQALSERTIGYKHLSNARQLVGKVVDIDSQFDQAQSLQTSIASADHALETSLHSAESSVSSQHFDEALAAVVSYRSFAEEEPRIAAIVADDYEYHLDRGVAFEGEHKWQEALQEYQKASEIQKTSDVMAKLSKAAAAYQASKNKAAADAASQSSEQFEQEGDYTDAYEILAALPSAQRALVADRMKTLEITYIKSASEAAKKLEQAHTPIRGRADEIGVQKAYGYLQRASSLQDNQDLKLRLDLLSQTISDYYVEQAKRYLDKPLGSGIGVAWLYLDEAQQYKANRDDVRNERTKSSSVHYLRSKLSIRVVFRDQTSRRDSAGFADQLSDAIATGLETSGLPVKVVRSNDTTTVEPNFQLIGDVVQHRPIIAPAIEPMESKYRAGEREVPNEDWNKANRDYETASLDLQSAQRALEGAQAHGKKKDIAEANGKVADTEKKVQESHRKLDSIPKTIQNDVIKPYTYTKKTYELSGVVELAFRIVDSNGTTIDAITPITRNAHKATVVFENVKPEDTEGVKVQGSPPDETQFLTDLEIEARDALIKEVKEKVEELPLKILAQARQRVADGDLDGAAEAYILYLNSTPEVETADRGEAKRFLQEQFNITKIASSAS